MMNHASLTALLRHGLWAEAAATATLTENMLVTKDKLTAPYVQMFGKEPNYVRNLRTFREIGVVSNHAQQKIRGKPKDRGRPCLFLGYSKNHAADVYRRLNLETRKEIHTRDIIWMNQTYGQYKNITATNTVRDY
jgi:hypothetical protein